jgi:hypothetical protein
MNHVVEGYPGNTPIQAGAIDQNPVAPLFPPRQGDGPYHRTNVQGAP